jgi:cytochrome P450
MLDSDLRRIEPARARHYIRSSVAAALLVAGAVSIGLAIDNWFALVVVLGAFTVGAVALAWQARPRRGRAEGWPIGDLRPGPEGVTDIDHYSVRAARYGSVFKSSFHERPSCCIVDLEFAGTVLREHRGDLPPPWDSPGRFVPGGSIRGSTDDARNAELRRLYARSLTAGLVHSWAPVLELRISGALTALTDESKSATDGVEPRPAIRALVRATWCELFLGIGPDAPEFAEVDELIRVLDPDRHLYGAALADADVEAGLDRLAALVRRAHQQRDRSLVGTTWADAFEAQRPGALGDPGLVRNLIYSTVTSYDDMAGLLAWVMWYLAEQPQWVRRMRSEPECADLIADRFVSETLRLAQSEVVIREARVDIHVGEVTIPRGWIVRTCVRECHRDAAKFPEPERFDPERFSGDPVGRDRYSPFGLDHRSCLGEHLARATGRAFVRSIACGFDVVTLRAGPVELSEKRHWAPSSRWRVGVGARVDADDRSTA